MSNRFNVSIEGPQARGALAELLAIDGIEGDAGPAHRGPVRRDAGFWLPGFLAEWERG